MSYKMHAVKVNMINLMVNNTTVNAEKAYQTVIEQLNITLSTAEKHTVISDVIGTIIHC